METLGGIEDPLPASIAGEGGFIPRWEAIRNAHFPPREARLSELEAFRSPAHVRLILVEFFFFEAGLFYKRQRARQEPGIAFRADAAIRESLKKVLPFHPTTAQKKALAEIVEDMRAPHPMRRLLQGDVGSGKTIVAVLAALLAVENGLQAAIMVPTEILAAQHHERLERLLGGRGWRLGLLSQSTRGAERRRLLEALGAGEVDLLVGTHALIQRPVRFKSLGLVVVDEQHRFGVVQRQALLEKGPRPDLLVMTATPIPRTLALTLYGDLDLSVLDEPPPGRQPIQTSIVPPSGREGLYARVRAEAAAGRQIYIITPVIDDADVRGLKAATALAARLARGPLAGIPLGLLHGRLDPEVKLDAMRRFAAGDLKALVATSLVEVGIDVPEATGMVIENAERFGLSQLHQLRGRVGRGPRPSWCALVPSESADAEALERLQAFLGCADGFEVAEVDLRLRGSGELFGARQSGLGELKLADLVRHQDLVELARNEAFAWVEAERARGGGLDAGVLEEVRRRWPEHSRWLTEG
jgi:ATP-dependent DNA helicase RecG